MVLDNDEAEKRHGVAPIYKGVKGFHPLQVTWDRYLIDAIFRGGAKHCNHADSARKTLLHLVQRIRREYGAEVPILVRMDSGFFDQKLLEPLAKLGVGVIVAGKLYKDIQERMSRWPEAQWQVYDNGCQQWKWAEMGDRRGSWSHFWRALYLKRVVEDGQVLRCAPNGTDFGFSLHVP